MLFASGQIQAQGQPSPYEAWETASGIPGAGAGVDSDGDGISNGIEFVIGGDPSGPDSDSNSLLPTVTPDGDYMCFTFRRTDASAGYDPYVEYSSDVAEWTIAEPGVNGVLIEEDVGSEVALVTVRIPRAMATGMKLFGRLRVEITS